MARIPRIHIDGALYYVTSRGDNNKEIFKDSQDYAFYLELLKKYKQQYEFKLFTFCFIPDHLHLLVELKAGITISDIMHDLNANYTKYFNSKYARKGHLFQERYKLVLLEKNLYLKAVSVYIHLNPLSLGLVKDIVDYPYSSYGDYSGSIESGGQNSLRIDMDEEIREFRRVNSGIKYGDILKSFSKQEMAELGKSLRKKSIMGSVDFVKKVKYQMEIIGSKNQIQANNRGVNKKFVFAGLTVVVLLSFFSLYFYGRTIWLKKNFANEMEERDEEIETQYRRQMDLYYRQMIKSLQREKKKVEYLQEKLGGEN